jgi:hypothetical protein
VESPDEDVDDDKMDHEQVRLMNGVLLGHGRVHTAKNLIKTKSEDREFIEWLADEFSNIGGRVIRIKDEFEFRTGRFDWVEKWHDRWYYRNKKIIPRILPLSPVMAGVWYHERGSVHDTYGRVKINMHGMEYSRHNAQEALSIAGFETFESFGHIEMAEDVGSRFLEWKQDLPQLF